MMQSITNYIKSILYTIILISGLITFSIGQKNENNPLNCDTTTILKNIEIARHLKINYNDSAIEYLRHTYYLSKDCNFLPGMVNSCFELGEIYKHHTLYSEAINMVNDLLLTIDDTANLPLRAKCLYSLGEYNRAAENNMSFNYLDDALDIYKKIKDTTGIAKTCNRLAAAYFEKQNYEQTLAYIDTSMFFARTKNNFNLMANNTEIMGAVFKFKQKYTEAIKTFYQSADLFIKSEDTIGLINTLANIARTFQLMGDNPKAITIALQAYAMADKQNIKIYTISISKILADTYKSMGDYKKAFEYLEIYDNQRTVAFYDERDKQISRLNALYELRKKEEEKQKLIHQNTFNLLRLKQQKIIVISFIITLILMTVVLIQFILSRRYHIKAYRILNEKNILVTRQAEELHTQAENLSKTYSELKELNIFKDSITAMIVHDLKNPLNSILSIYPRLNENQRSKFIFHKARQMLNLISNILDVYKFDTAKMKIAPAEIKIDDLLTHAIDDIRYFADEKQITLTVEYPENNNVFADNALMHRALVNLMHNAIKFTPVSGNVKIQVQPYDKMLRFSIKDNGKGIPADKLPLVFEKFTPISQNENGELRSSGLGLAFCKMVVEAHEGEIGVFSEPEKGCEFWFTLPAKIHPEWKQKTIEIQSFLSIHFSDEEKRNIAPFTEKLQQLEIYRVSEIKSILKEIPFFSNTVEDWKQQIIRALRIGDENIFQQLISLTK